MNNWKQKLFLIKFKIQTNKQKFENKKQTIASKIRNHHNMSYNNSDSYPTSSKNIHSNETSEFKKVLHKIKSIFFFN